MPIDRIAAVSKGLRRNLLQDPHLAVILLQMMIWIGTVAGALFVLYSEVFSEIDEVEIRAVALTVSVVVGFIAVRFPFSILRLLFAVYVIMPLMGSTPSHDAGLRGSFFSRWYRTLRGAGWDTTLAETPSYKDTAEEIGRVIKKIEGELKRARSDRSSLEVKIGSRIHALDIGEEYIRGRIVNLNHFQDESFLNRLAVGARSESVRIAARRRLAFLRSSADDQNAYIVREYSP